MARFYVGQRVRVVATDAGSRYRCVQIGDEGFVTEVFDGPFIRISIPGKRNHVYDLPDFPMCPWEIEPILDSKHEACDEDFKRDLDHLLERQGVAA